MLYYQKLVIFLVMIFSYPLHLDAMRGSHKPQDVLQYVTKVVTNVQRYKEKFADVLLVINFNHPHYGNIPFLKELYGPVFKNIVFYGEASDSQVYKVYSNQGVYLSQVLQDVLVRFPDYKGYLVLQDDCVINFWNYLKLDLNKIWYAVKHYNGKNSFNNFVSIKNSNGQYTGADWPGWKQPHCFRAAINACHQLLPQDIYFLQKNLGINNVASQVCDMFYFPQRHREAMMRLSVAFQPVMCEVAITTMLCCLDLIEDWEQLNMLWTTDVQLVPYPMSYHWLHPVKFSQKHKRVAVLEVVKKILSQ